ncbi:MAG: hypothetical protein HKP58_01320 [Desulfatitalea sp.]|nr:ecdysteroid 22-kinase family protein [Desulfatitalea sp.]NNJ99026.1 hypothetical protein [Desulfatitalea sp.]
MKKHHPMKLPLEVKDLTPQWFTHAHANTYPETQVSDVHVDSVQWGTATKVFVDLTYASDPGPDGPPARLVVKAGFNPEFREIIAACFVTEANFYQHIAPQMKGMVPNCWFAGADPDVKQGAVLIEDLDGDFCQSTYPLACLFSRLVRCVKGRIQTVCVL